MSAGPDYAAVLTGRYPRRGEDGGASVTQNLRKPAADYGETVTKSTGPVLTRMRDAGGVMKDKGRRIIESRRPESGSPNSAPMDPTPSVGPSTGEHSVG